MNVVGNVLWFILCGLIIGIFWVIVGLFWCITLVGIPIGVQCFKCSRMAFFPFGKDVFYSNKMSSFLLNFLWIIFGGIELAITSCVFGALLCVTIIGIPFGIQCFKIAKLSLMPFGTEIINLK